MGIRTYLGIAAFHFVMPLGHSIAIAPEADPSAGATVAVAPVLRFAAGTKIAVRVAFENTSDHAIKYLMPWPEENGLTNLQFSLYKDGQLQRKIVVARPPLADRRFVRELPPGNRIVDHADFTDFYGKLRPGTYELRARYEVDERSWYVKELGLTPIHLNRTIAYLEIEGPGEPPVQRPAAKEAGDAPARLAETEDAPVAVAPLLRFPAGADIVVPVAFENSSDRTMHYLIEWPDESRVAFLNFSLYRGGVFQKPLVTPRYPPTLKTHVRALPPGGRVVDRAHISDTYGKLPPGTYDLHARYEVGAQSWMVKEFGMTPMSFHRTIAYLEIEGPREPTVQRPAAKEAGDASTPLPEKHDARVEEKTGQVRYWHFG